MLENTTDPSMTGVETVPGPTKGPTFWENILAKIKAIAINSWQTVLFVAIAIVFVILFALFIKYLAGKISKYLDKRHTESENELALGEANQLAPTNKQSAEIKLDDLSGNPNQVINANQSIQSTSDSPDTDSPNTAPAPNTDSPINTITDNFERLQTETMSKLEQYINEANDSFNVNMDSNYRKQLSLLTHSNTLEYQEQVDTLNIKHQEDVVKIESTLDKRVCKIMKNLLDNVITKENLTSLIGQINSTINSHNKEIIEKTNKQFWPNTGVPSASGGVSAPPSSGGISAPPSSGGVGAPPSSGGADVTPSVKDHCIKIQEFNNDIFKLNRKKAGTRETEIPTRFGIDHDLNVLEDKLAKEKLHLQYTREEIDKGTFEAKWNKLSNKHEEKAQNIDVTAIENLEKLRIKYSKENKPSWASNMQTCFNYQKEIQQISETKKNERATMLNTPAITNQSIGPLTKYNKKVLYLSDYANELFEMVQEDESQFLDYIWEFPDISNVSEKNKLLNFIINSENESIKRRKAHEAEIKTLEQHFTKRHNDGLIGQNELEARSNEIKELNRNISRLYLFMDNSRDGFAKYCLKDVFMWDDDKIRLCITTQHNMRDRAAQYDQNVVTQPESSSANTSTASSVQVPSAQSLGP